MLKKGIVMAFFLVRSRRPGSRARLALASSLLAMTIATPAFAQETPDSAPAPADTTVAAQNQEPDAAIVVTGSRIARPELSLPNPVQVLSAETVEQSGKVNLTDFLVNSPALLGSQTSIFSAGSNLAGAQSVGINL